MRRRRCKDDNCPDCHPERWQPQDGNHHGLPWPWTLVLLGLLVALAMIYVSGSPGP